MKVKAAVLREAGQGLAIETLDVIGPHRGELLVKIVAAGMCHSDLHAIDGHHPSMTPIVLGHEGAGIVEAVGEGITDFAVGDHVLLTGCQVDNTCWYCKGAHYTACDQVAGVMVSALAPDNEFHLKNGDEGVYQMLGQGSFAEKIVVPTGGAVKIDKSIPLDKACILSCAGGTGMGAVFNTAKVHVGSHVVVIGCGGIGLMAIQAAAIAGASKMIAVDVLDNKLAFAKTVGATDTINAATEADVQGKATEIAGGRIDYAFECIGKTDLMALAFNMVGRNGKAVIVGASGVGDQLCLDAIQLILTGKQLLGCLGGECNFWVDVPAWLELYKEGKLKVDEFITKTYPLEKINEGFKDLKEGKVIRGVITFK